jgi:uncharacterized protein (DUF1800 family)
MDRRTFIGKAIQRNHQHAMAAPPVTSLLPYSGSWTTQQAAHLLRRTTFGPSISQIQQATQIGLDNTIALLFNPQPLPEPPLNPNNQNDPNVPVGDTWINAPYLATVNLQGYRNTSLRAWNFSLILSEGISIRGKMTLFWHNHFAINNINDPKFVYKYITLLRSSALGNFRQLVKEVTIDPAMLRFLNGNQNTRNAPNENYARELLELFTLGKGPAVGPGDYTTFTEQDVLQIARVLTGWRDRGFNSVVAGTPVESFFLNSAHDTGTKQLSHRFNNAAVTNQGADEYAFLIDLIFQKEEVAYFIARKLYRWFVYYVIDEPTEAMVIEPMAQLLINNNYEIRPALEALLRSEHFFDSLNKGPMIKNPLDFVAGTLKQFNITFSPLLNRKYNAWNSLFRLTIPMQMEYFNPPDVAGWKAYYQEPVFYRTWINSATLAPRMAFVRQLATTGYVYNTVRHVINVLELVESLSDPTDPNTLIGDLAAWLYPQALSAGQLAYLKEVLIPGLPDYEWTIEYNDYLSNPADAELRMAVESKLRDLMVAMLSMPEYHLS